MEGSVNTLEQRFQIISQAVAELSLAQKSLTELKDVDKGSNLLVPVGGGVFMGAELGDISNIIVDVGANVSVEMPYDKAVEDVNSRLTEMRDAQNSVQQQLTQIIAQLESHQSMAERISAELQSGRPGAA